MEDEELCKLHMLTSDCRYTQSQIDEYINRGISNFMKLGGNIPWGEFIKKYEKLGVERVSSTEPTGVPTNERFYLARQPFAYCGHIKADYWYKKPIFSDEDCAPITGLNLISLTTHETIRLDIRKLLIKGRFLDGETYKAKGTINTHIFDVISNAIPYITLKEVLQETVRFIGNKHIYFEEEIVKGKGITYWGEPYLRSVYILNGYFAENVCYTSR